MISTFALIFMLVLLCTAVIGVAFGIRFIGRAFKSPHAEIAMPPVQASSTVRSQAGAGITGAVGLFACVLVVPSFYWSLAKADTVKPMLPVHSTEPTHGMSGINPELPESPQATQAEAPPEAPKWADEPNVVVSEPRASAKSSRQEALQAATKLLMSHYSQDNQGVGKWLPDLERLDTKVISREDTRQIAWDLAAGTDFQPKEILPGTAYQTYMQVDLSEATHAAVYQQWKAQASHERLEGIMFVFGGITAAIALLAMYSRIEKRGFVRRSVRFASLMTALGLGIGSTVAGVEAFSETNHAVPASHAAEAGHARQSSRERRHRTQTGEPSNFAGITLRANRLAFVVVGDSHFADGDKIDRVAAEILQCIEGLNNQADYRVICESNKGRKLARGTAAQAKLRTIRQTLQKCFTSNSEAVLPRNAIDNLIAFDPDQIVLIRDADSQSDSESDLRDLVRLFRPADMPVHVVEIDEGREDPRAELFKLAQDTGGQCVVWPGRSGETN